MSISIKHWQDPVNLILGLWLIVSPWALKYL
jgi:SPW repeat